MMCSRISKCLLAIISLSLFLTALPALAITAGHPDGDAHPYVGLIVFDVGGGPAWRCSGSLIAPNVVLTAGHCTDGATAARIWLDEIVEGNPDYPVGGSSSVEAFEIYTHPDFCLGCGSGNGLPGFSTHDVGVLILSEPVDVGGFATLPTPGLVDTLKNKTDLDLVGYGVQEQQHGGGPPYWTGLRNRLYAPSKMVSGKFVHSDEYMRIALNPGGGTGGSCFGDSGGPDLLGGTNTVLAVHSYVTNYNCAGVGYSNRVDTAEILDWINGLSAPGAPSRSKRLSTTWASMKQR
ncbi:trypsin-like serine protease [Candidatus Poribacteria bacterium]